MFSACTHHLVRRPVRKESGGCAGPVSAVVSALSGAGPRRLNYEIFVVPRKRLFDAHQRRE